MRHKALVRFVSILCPSIELLHLYNFNNIPMYQVLLTGLENNILTITINRPDKLNAINNQVMNELEFVIKDVYENAEIRSAIITGSGDKSFVAGADIIALSGLSVDEGTRLARKGQDLFKRIETCPKPVIAAVNGFALGGGCELAMACHIRIAADNARFGQPEVSLGLIPGYGGTQRLVQLIGKGRAMELLMTGNTIDANTALQFGLVNYVVSAGELLNEAKSLLTVVNAKAPQAVARCIEAANAVYDEKQNGFEIEIAGFGSCFGTEDMKEGVAAFTGKRKPVFTGR